PPAAQSRVAVRRSRPHARLPAGPYPNPLCKYGRGSYWMNTAGCSLFPPSRVGAFTTSCTQVDRAVGNRNAEGRTDRPRHQADFTAMRAHQLRSDRQAKSCATGARRALKSLEHVGARLFGDARPGIGHLDDHDAAFTPPSNANLVTCRIARATHLQSLHRITRNIDQHAEQLIVIGLNGETAFHGHDPSNRHIKAESKRLVHFLNQRFDFDRLALGWRLLRTAVRECRLAERDRAFERAHQLGRETLHLG